MAEGCVKSDWSSSSCWVPPLFESESGWISGWIIVTFFGWFWPSSKGFDIAVSRKPMICQRNGWFLAEKRGVLIVDCIKSHLIMNIYTYLVCVYLYIYIFIYSIHIYLKNIYIYLYTYRENIYIYKYTHTYRERERERERAREIASDFPPKTVENLRGWRCDPSNLPSPPCFWNGLKEGPVFFGGRAQTGVRFFEWSHRVLMVFE